MWLYSGNQKLYLPILCRYNGNPLPISDEAKFLGVIFTKNLTWVKHVSGLADKSLKAFNVLKSLAHTHWGADPKILLMYKPIVRSHFEYSFVLLLFQSYSC